MTSIHRVAPLALLLANPAHAQSPPTQATDRPSPGESLHQRVRALEEVAERLRQEREEEELATLRREADARAAIPSSEAEQGDTVFTSANRALQALNPELSIVVDAGARAVLADRQVSTLDRESSFQFRIAGIHLETNLDPFSFLKAAIGVTPTGVTLGEAYATWTEVLPDTSLTLGKFRQQLGVVNRWHVPSLDQWDFPLALTTLLGPGGLNQIGISLAWVGPPLWADSQGLTLQLTNGMSGHLFSGDLLSVPSGLARVNSYYDLGEQTYAELGLTAMLGWNNRRGATVLTREPAFDESGQPVVLYDADGNELESVTVVTGETRVDEPWRKTWLAGADLTISSVPLDRERFAGITWRSELYLVRKKTAAGIIRAMGGYSYLDWRLSEAWVIGARADVTQPFAVDNHERLLWQAVAYTTWWQSPWVKLRLQYGHRWGAGEPDRDQVIAQVVFAAGPHKHERY